MIRKQLAVVSFFCVAACAPAAAQMGGMGGMGGAPGGMAGQVVLRTPEGETMVVPLPDGWTPYAREAEEKDERYIFPAGQVPSDWREALRQETYRTTAGIATAERVYELRTGSDQNSCESFASEKLGEGPENGYSMVLWRQVCEFADGQTLAQLNKTVLGNDHLHILSMIWNEDPPTRSWTQWSNFMNRVYVCDTDREEHPCRTTPLPGGLGGMRR
ncbi:MAG: hypothetical protein OXI73_04865 [Rhodospirillales bacterium]|nr:hypothetical protein [Rhodospirillales bacterium]